MTEESYAAKWKQYRRRWIACYTFMVVGCVLVAVFTVHASPRTWTSVVVAFGANGGAGVRCHGSK